MRMNKGYVVEAGRILGTVLLCLAFMSESAVAARKTYYIPESACSGWTANYPCAGGRGMYTANVVMTCSFIGDMVLPANITSLVLNYTWLYAQSENASAFISFNGNSLGQSNVVSNPSCVYAGQPFTKFPTISWYLPGVTNTISATNYPSSMYNQIKYQTVGGISQVLFILEMEYTPVVLSTPSHGGFTNSLTPAISWAALTGSTSYQLQIDEVPFFNSGALIDKTITGSVLNYTLNGTPPELLTNGGSYYARLKPRGGTYGERWSIPTTFTVDTSSPPAPTPNQPAADSTIPTQTPLFNWSPVTSGSE
ncbi:MAG: hypothetical protein A2X28_10835 [Elusimicrobia bacterium GWA2_56_46]|nr:MAG: hypothetical protein A2X28_10835 [Elusimicrobia bacterium GWA2_56_46]OGR55760.1 MAG: hypothetical protein A2X39_10455 [Elusimicrobia bacterium GWC2_56_31]HBB66656.1 hypothetical protein [Elusimicrobiota bacterium]HBW23569.1 hypothetical protein [Elusimicrobiota bacterium]